MEPILMVGEVLATLEASKSDWIDTHSIEVDEVRAILQ